MSDSKPPKRSFFDDLADGFDEGYKLQDEKIKKESEPIHEKAKDGVVEGFAETTFNPIRWIRAIFF